MVFIDRFLGIVNLQFIFKTAERVYYFGRRAYSAKNLCFGFPNKSEIQYICIIKKNINYVIFRFIRQRIQDPE